MLPVVVAAGEHQPLLAPDDLAADGEAAGLQALGDGGGVQRAVPGVDDLAGEQRPGLAPVRPVVVQHLAGALGRRQPGLVAPGRVVAHAIGRVRHQQVRPHPAQQPRHVSGVGRAAAEQPMRSEEPEVACLGNRYRRRLRVSPPRAGRARGGRAARRARPPRSRGSARSMPSSDSSPSSSASSSRSQPACSGASWLSARM